MSVVLNVQGLEKSFGAVVAAHNINVTIEEGETVGVIGANGAGKTTFVNMVTGYLPPTKGRIEFMGRDIRGRSVRQITRLGLCRSFQVPQVFLSESVFDNLTIAFGIAEHDGLGLLGPLMRDDRAGRVDKHLVRYQIADYRDVAGSALPQGVRKLLDISMATVRKPKLLMLDEPTSGISAEEKFGIMDILMQALKEEETTVLFIEHDMEIVERYVSRVLAFSQGEIICDAPTEEAMVDPPGAGIRHRQGIPPRPVRQWGRDRGRRRRRGRRLMLTVKDVDVSIGATEILRGVSLTVPSGSMCGLIGRNGAGKTTVMRAIMGALKLHRERSSSRMSISAPRTPIAAPISASASCRKTAAWCPSSRRKRTSCCRSGRPNPKARKSASNGSTV